MEAEKKAHLARLRVWHLCTPVQNLPALAAPHITHLISCIESDTNLQPSTKPNPNLNLVPMTTRNS